jgi:hypothetical protein
VIRTISIVRLLLTLLSLLLRTSRARDDFVQLHGAIYVTGGSASAQGTVHPGFLR